LFAADSASWTLWTYNLESLLLFWLFNVFKLLLWFVFCLSCAREQDIRATIAHQKFGGVLFRTKVLFYAHLYALSAAEIGSISSAWSIQKCRRNVEHSRNVRPQIRTCLAMTNMANRFM
jgi:hypothetical protein